MALTNELAKMAVHTCYGSLPEKVIEDTKLHILDTIGCAFRGKQLGEYSRITEIYRELGGKPESSVIGDGYRIPSVNAAFSNSVMIKTAAYEDTHRLSVTHPAVVVIPAALAMAEREGADGQTLLSSVVVGYEVLTRIGMALPPSFMNRGFQPIAVLAPFGAAAAAGKILSFGEETMADALSLSANLGSGLIEVMGSLESQPVQIAKGCQAGVLSALLAQNGLKGCHTILEGGSVCSHGFLKAFSDTVDVKKITQNLGKEFEISKTSFKIHYGCRYVHASIDAALGCIERYPVDLDSIHSIELRITSVAHNFLNDRPQTGEEARFNIPYVVSVALLQGRVDCHSFSNEKLKDSKTRQLMNKVRVIRDQKLDEEYKKTDSHFSTIIHMTTTDGTVKSHRVDFPKGEPEFPASKEELIQKFKMLVSGVVNNGRADKIITTLGRLETLKNASEFIGLIS